MAILLLGLSVFRIVYFFASKEYDIKELVAGQTENVVEKAQESLSVEGAISDAKVEKSLNAMIRQGNKPGAKLCLGISNTLPGAYDRLSLVYEEVYGEKPLTHSTQKCAKKEEISDLEIVANWLIRKGPKRKAVIYLSQFAHNLGPDARKRVNTLYLSVYGEDIDLFIGEGMWCFSS